ncbi:MAG: hypothetical protein QNJ47_03005 [Nostocaceae cyanobacterium]|nr:hypothetical protein [Nostocaceae cyanobacterium]
MSNRLQIFRERMAAFEGAANPQQAIESGYYVTAPGKLLAEKLSARVALRPASSHLLIGGIGSGKTTQLLVACENLKKIDDIYPIYVDVSLHTDISQITPGVLTAIAGLELSKLIEDTDNENIQELVKTISDIAYGYSEKINIVDVLNIYTKVSKTEGIIPAKNNYGVEADLVETFITLVAYISKKYDKKIVLLFDGLDRLEDSKAFLEILTSDAKAITNAKVGLVIVGPLTSLYGDYRVSIENSLDYFYHQPCFDVENDPEAYNFFVQILKARLQDDFIEESVIDALVKFSGGILRDLINLTQSGIEEAYISGDDKITKKHVANAVLYFGKAQILGVSNEEFRTLVNIIKTEKSIAITHQNVKLLVTRRIIEYEHPKQRYAVHPAIAAIIEGIYA